MLANRDIKAGEEITVSYIAHFLPRLLRQLSLREGWSFACQCPVCDLSHPSSHSHEQRLEDHYRLCQDSCMDVDGQLRPGGTWSYAALERAAERAQKRIELLAEHHALRNFSRQAYMPLNLILTPSVLTVRRYLGAFDIALAQYKMKRLRSKLGDAVKLLELVIEADKIYYGATGAVTQEDKRLYSRLQRGDIPGI